VFAISIGCIGRVPLAWGGWWVWQCWFVASGREQLSVTDMANTMLS